MHLTCWLFPNHNSRKQQCELLLTSSASQVVLLRTFGENMCRGGKPEGHDRKSVKFCPLRNGINPRKTKVILVIARNLYI